MRPRLVASLLLLTALGGAAGAFAQAPSPAMPDAGFSAEVFHSDLFTGAATFAVPLSLPPGVSGMTPSITLSYNSGAGNGWLGVGWGLDFGFIGRSAKVPGGFMIQIPGAVSELVGINVDSSGIGEYRTQTDTFLKITFDGLVWTVREKSGRRNVYGSTVDSRVGYDRATGAGTSRWHLDTVADPSGNTISYAYHYEESQLYPLQIDYTSNPVVGLPAQRRVRFYHETRPDRETARFPGGLIVTTGLRLKAIDVISDVVTGQRAIGWGLTYAQSQNSKRSLLTGITRYASNGSVTAAGVFIGSGQMPSLSLSYADVPLGRSFNVVSAGVGAPNNQPTWPLLGDFNGDGKADLLWRDGTIWRSNGNGTFDVFNPGVTGLAAILNANPRIGDVDGDGRSDVIGLNGPIYRSNGDMTFASLSAPPGPLVCPPVDYLGHGMADLITSGGDLYVAAGGGAYVSGGDLWSDPSPFPCSAAGDFNGDGKADLYFGAGAIWFSHGNGSFQGISAVAKAGAIAADFNADGKADLFFPDGTIWLSEGDGTFTAINVGVGSGTPVVGDVNGDGQADILWIQTSGAVTFWSAVPGNTPPDRLIGIANGFGGSATIAYTKSTQLANTLLPMPIWTVASTTISNGLGWTASTTYSFSGGLWSGTTREFRGFSTAVVTDPIGTKTTTTFWQDDVKRGQVMWSKVETAAGALLTHTQHTYSDISPHTGVMWPRLDRTDVYQYEGQGTPRQTTVAFEYETIYGNLTRKYDVGLTDVTGDERDEFTEWTVDPATWIHRPRKVWLVAGGVTLRERWLSYDGLAWGTVGGYGRLTREEFRLGGGLGTPGNPAVTHGYDAYGHRTSTVDARGCLATTVFEARQIYPASVTNCLGHVSTSTYDARFGTVLTVTDPNGQTTSHEYDVFGRITKTTGPLDTSSSSGTASFFYQDWGVPNAQRVTVHRTEQHGTANVTWHERFFDGLGRENFARKEGPGGVAIETETTFDVRGLASAISAPHFTGQAAVWTQFGYDALGRKTLELYPDGSQKTWAFAPGLVTLTDERGSVKRQFQDGYGRLSRVEEVNGGATYATTHTYNAAGSLLQVTNHVGHVTTNTYDLLGRKTQMQDPNMGTWIYTYDAAGSMLTQRDAKNQTLTFQYDALGRVKKKIYPNLQEITWTYDDPAVLYSKGRVTRVVDLATVTTFQYDKMGRATQTQRTLDAVTYTMSQTYDALSRVTTQTFPDGEIVSFNFNEGGWLQSIPGYVTNINYNARGQQTSLTYANGIATTFTYDPQTFRLTRKQAGAGFTTGPATVLALRSWVKSWTTQVTAPVPPGAGFAFLYRGGICVTDVSGVCVGGDATTQSGLGAVIGYYKTASGTGTVPLYAATCYADGTGACTKRGLTLTANGSAVGYLATTAPDGTSAGKPFRESGGLLLQGLGSPGNAFAWTAPTQTITTNHVDHKYVVDTNPVEGYTADGIVAYLHQNADGGATVALTRYFNGTTGHHYYQTSGTPPAGFGSAVILGYLHPSGGAGLTALYRDYNATSLDYKLTTAATPASGYVRQATLGYVHTAAGSGEPINIPLPSTQDLAYTYDAGGNVLTIADSVGTASRTFTYDPLNRLASATGTFGPPSGGLPTSTNETYQYSAIGNFTSKGGITYAYSDPLHPSAVTATSDGRTYTFDANGNTVNGAGRQFTWDADNRLGAVTIQGGNSAEFAYDYTGRRVRKTVNGASVTRYPFAGYEIASDGTITKFVGGAAKKGTSKLFYHNDHLGGVNAITDINALRVQLVEYDPWGKVARNEGTADTTHRFTGQFLDPETGLYYYGGRYYDPVLGRFISPDPFIQAPANPQNLNRYAYVVNNPVNFIDPSGFFFKSLFKNFGKSLPGLIVGIAVGVAVSFIPGLQALGPVVAGLIAGAIGGAAAGATNAAVNGGNILEGALIGGVLGAAGGAFGGAIGPPLAGSMGQFGGTVTTAAIVSGAMSRTVALAQGASFGQAVKASFGAAITAAGTAAVMYGGSLLADDPPLEGGHRAQGPRGEWQGPPPEGPSYPGAMYASSTEVACDVCSSGSEIVEAGGADRLLRFLFDWRVDGQSGGFKHQQGRLFGVTHRPTGLNIRLDLHPLPGSPQPQWHINIGRGGEGFHVVVPERWIPNSWKPNP
jgi:RHS repeat-associated protein